MCEVVGRCSTAVSNGRLSPPKSVTTSGMPESSAEGSASTAGGAVSRNAGSESLGSGGIAATVAANSLTGSLAGARLGKKL